MAKQHPLAIQVLIFFKATTTPQEVTDKKMASFPVATTFEIRAVVRFCALRGLDNGTIYEQLCETYGPAALSLTAVKVWAKRFREGRTSLEDDPRAGRPQSQDYSQLVEDVLAERPFSTSRAIADIVGCSHPTILAALEAMGYKKFLSRWVPHELTDEQKAARVLMSRSLLATLTSLNPGRISSVITGDESWFYYEYPQEGRWARTREDVAPRPKRSIGAKKVMITVFWSTRGIHLIEALPDGETFNSEYACHLLDRLDSNLRELRPSMGARGMALHWDNARPHTSQQTLQKIRQLKLSQLSHPPYSPDIAPSDFFLFGYIKSQLKGQSFHDTDSLLAWINTVTRNISKEDLRAVFSSWMTRLQWVIENNGEYFIK